MITWFLTLQLISSPDKCLKSYYNFDTEFSCIHERVSTVYQIPIVDLIDLEHNNHVKPCAADLYIPDQYYVSMTKLDKVVFGRCSVIQYWRCLFFIL